MKKVLTLVLLRDAGRVLLGMKKRGFGSNRWNGFGGKVEKGETILQAAHRELLEECHMQAASLQAAGTLRFTFEGDPVALEVHVFTGAPLPGEPVETDEMRPAWFAENALPYDVMWADDRLWMPQVLAGNVVEGVFHFQGEQVIVSHTVKLVGRIQNA